jgi:hypothetical protein
MLSAALTTLFEFTVQATKSITNAQTSIIIDAITLPGTLIFFILFLLKNKPRLLVFV